MDVHDSGGFAVRTFGLTKSYGKRKAVDGIDLAIEEGELFSLLGPNGAGKTTTISMLCCLLRPSAGTATVMGRDILTEPMAVKELIDVSPQETAVAGHLTAPENLMLMGGVHGLPKAETRERADRLLELTGLADRTRDQVRTFSGGMQRRLSIAMALISDPRVLFLDEPTLGLDPQARRAMWRIIEKLKGDKTMILTTHYLEEADALADRAAIINGGSIVALDTPKGLKDSLVGTQTMEITCTGITEAGLDGLRSIYPVVKASGDTILIQGTSISFDGIVDHLRANGVKIEWLTMRKPTLDDVFLGITGEEVRR